MGSNEFIRVKVEGISQLEKMRAFLDPKLFQKATRAGILAAATSANKQAGKSISQRYNIGSRRIKQDAISKQVRVLAKDITLDQGVLNRM